MEVTRLNRTKTERCPFCNRKAVATQIENEATHIRISCENCRFGYVMPA